MSGNDNKGKFSDRLKRMKLYRSFTSKKIIIIDGKIFREEEIKVDESRSVNKEKNNIISNKIIGSASVGAFAVGKVVSNTFSDDSKVKKHETVGDKIKRSAISGASVGAAVVGATLVNIAGGGSNTSSDDSKVEKHETVGDKIKRSAISGASVGTAVVGATLVNIAGGRSNTSSDLNNSNAVSNISKDSSKSNNGINSNREYKSIDQRIKGNSPNKKVFRVGQDIILVDKISDKDIKDGDRKTYLAAQIIKKIKREFEKKLNEIEVLESELYLLNEANMNELDLEKCKEIKKEIEKNIEKINHIIEQYNIYKFNRILDDMLSIDDTSLVNDISDFKRLYEGALIQRRLVSDYELIDEYQKLYGRLNDIKLNVEQVSKKNNEKIGDFDERDKKYDKIKSEVVTIDEFNDKCKYYINNQEKYIAEMAAQVSHIDIENIVNYKLHGFGSLLSNGLRYLGMFAISPLMGTMYGIGMRTYAANGLVNNLRKSLSLDKITSTVYKANDYQFELNEKINTLEYNYDNIDKTLDNVSKLKSEFKKQYNYDIPGYNETMRKINDIEIMLNNNKDKLNLIKSTLKKNKKNNEGTLVKCKILEKESKPVVDRV